jgi:nitric oxide reductase NorD protein
MALDEYIFGKFIKYLKNKPVDTSLQNRTVKLEEVSTRLILLARALTGKAVEIFPAIKEGGYKGNNFFLPGIFSFYKSKELNFSFYLFRVIYLSVQQNLMLNWFNTTPLPDTDARVCALQNSSQVLAKLFAEFPSAKDIYEQLLVETNPESGKSTDTFWLYGKWMPDTKEYPQKDKADLYPAELKDIKMQSRGTSITAKAVEEIISLAVDIKQQEDYVLTHNFEKVETADEFSGTWRDFDGEDDLEKHADALDELNMKYTVRVDDAAHSVYETSFSDNTTVAESADMDNTSNSILYDEWDCYKKEYRRDYSKVFPSQHSATSIEYYEKTLSQNKSTLTQLRKMLASINNKWQKKRLQTQGKEIDADMATDRFADVYSGHTPSDKVYVSDRKNEKDLSLLILLDISLSSDSYAAGNRVIDIEKQTAILFSEILHEYKIDFSVHCFYSKTRNYLSYTTLKAFDEKWEVAKYRTGTIEPAGYTRIGPALRHSGSLLKARETRNKWVILLSDGKPNDYDRYEGRYGINDVKQALRELGRHNINTYALAIEANAKYYLPQMFGQNHYQIVSSPVELLRSLVKLYERIRHNS